MRVIARPVIPCSGLGIEDILCKIAVAVAIPSPVKVIVVVVIFSGAFQYIFIDIGCYTLIVHREIMVESYDGDTL